MKEIFIDLIKDRYSFKNVWDKDLEEVPIKKLKNKLVLVHRKDYTAVDMPEVTLEKGNFISQKLGMGYRVLNGLQREIVAEECHICPFCGQNADISQKASHYIIDIGSSMGNLSRDNYYMRKVLECIRCGRQSEYHTGMFIKRNKIKEELEQQSLLRKLKGIHIKYRYFVDVEKRAYAVIYLDLNSLESLYENKADDMAQDMENRGILSMLKIMDDSYARRYFNLSENPYVIGGLHFEKYQCYKNTEDDFRRLVQYKDASSNIEKIKGLIFG